MHVSRLRSFAVELFQMTSKSPLKSSKTTTISPYGTWKSKITSDLIIQKNIKFGEIQVLRPPSSSSSEIEIIYVENRPNEKGRAAIIKRNVDLNSDVLDLDPDHEQLQAREGQDGQDLTLGKYNSRSGIHEYGGGSIRSIHNGGFIFTDYNPQSFGVYQVEKGRDGKMREPKLITPENPVHRFGDFAPHPFPSIPHFVSILEDHTEDAPSKVKNSLVLNNPITKTHRTLISGCDFYSNPTFSKDGNFLAWVQWNHPEMPFWNTELCVAEFDSKPLEANDDASPLIGRTIQIEKFIHNEREVIHRPLWSLDSNNRLFFTSDRENGFSNMYFSDVVSDSNRGMQATKPRRVLKELVAADFQEPAWSLNDSPYVQLDFEFTVCTRTKGGIQNLCLIHLPTRSLHSLRTFYNYTSFSQLRRIDENHLISAAVAHDLPSEIVIFDLEDSKKQIKDGLRKSGIETITVGEKKIKIIKRSSKVIKDGLLDHEWISEAEEIEYPTKLADGTASSAHALLLPPKNPNFSPPAGTSPPCITFVHGGPTSAAHAGFNMNWSYWTSRGWLVCVVNYGGSTGYGRKYMERLDSNWGVTDVLDCVHAAKYLGSSASASTASSSASSKDALSPLIESRQSNGAVELKLENSSKAWSILDGIVAGALSMGSLLSYTNLGSELLQTSEIRYSLGLVATAWIFGKVFRVQDETVNAIPSMGLQLSTTRGLSLPRWLSFLRSSASSSKRPFLISSYTSHFIARESILDIMVSETFQRWNVVTKAVVATKASKSRGTKESLEKGVGEEGKLDVLFPNLSPNLAVVQKIYQTIYPIIFGVDSEARSVPASNLPRADSSKQVISGGSAGGYTVLACLTDQPSVYSAGTSLYGVSDVTALAHESHKFESRYPLVLMGGTPEEIPDVYHERSPLFKADKIRAPILVLQGSVDEIVPPNQSEEICKAVEKNGGKCKYILFDGEGHGFRQSQNQKKALESEEAWYAEVFGFDRY